MVRLAQEFSPDAVLNCAAYTDVDGAESEPDRAMVVNATGAQWVAEAARETRALIVHVSTDYVFDGTAERPYRESDATHPLSSYGRSKLEGEHRVRAACPDDHAIVRTGWLYGPGRGFADWARSKLVAGETVPAVNDQRGSPTFAGEVADALIRIAESRHRGVYHFVNSGETTWYEMGVAIARAVGADTGQVRSIAEASLGRKAPRPAYSVLSVEHFERTVGARVRPWRDVLEAYLSESEES